LGNQYRLHSGLEKLRAVRIFVVAVKNGYIIIKNERVIKMSAATEGYNDLVKRIEDGFMEIDNDIIVDLRKQDDSYLALCRQIGDMERDYPFILNVTEGEGNISLTAEEHRVLVEYFRLSLKKDNIERKQIYFRGHTDGYAYLKRIGAV
jgi:hypothetical protein